MLINSQRHHHLWLYFISAHSITSYNLIIWAEFQNLKAVCDRHVTRSHPLQTVCRCGLDMTCSHPTTICRFWRWKDLSPPPSPLSSITPQRKIWVSQNLDVTCSSRFKSVLSKFFLSRIKSNLKSEDIFLPWIIITPGTAFEFKSVTNFPLQLSFAMSITNSSLYHELVVW